MIDLHCHTLASDGTQTPAQLVGLAHQLGFTHLAITDHDSVASVREAQGCGEACGIKVIPAVELSARYQGQPMDILGYGINPESPQLTRALRKMVARRNDRTPKIIDRLVEHGIEISLDDVLASAGGEVIGRPHVARALVNRGVVGSIQEAFERHIGRGRYGYVAKEVFTLEEAVHVIQKSGGIAVLAHPRYLHLSIEEFERMMDVLVGAGLSGIEVYYSQHSCSQVERFAAAAERRNLLATGGSDYHGETKPHINLGMGPGGKPVPERLAHDLLSFIARHRGAGE